MDININLNNKFKQYKIDFILFGILLVSSFLGFYKIGFQSPWLDELSTLQVSDPDLTFDETHLLIMTREGFPHLYFLSLKFLSSIFGHSIVTLRMFSTVFGILSVYFMFLFTKELINKNAGYIAAILITVNNFHIYHSQEARAYALLVFFVIFASYRMIKYIKNQNWINAILLGIACGLIPNAHPIGVLNIAVIYLTLLVFFLVSKEKLMLFKQLFVSLAFTLLVFYPVYQIISKVSKITSFWIPAASFENIKQAFVELFGSNVYIFYIYIISIIIFFIIIIFKIKHTKNFELNKLNYIFLSLVIFWIIINIGVIIIKSYLDISIILNRYFIGSLPLFIITLAYIISLIKNKYLSSFVIILFAGYSLHFLIYQRGYYSNIYKSQWNSLSSEIIKNNQRNDKLYSAYGFVSNILFKNTNCYSLMKEINFEDYLKSVKLNSVEKESFWYFDGNFRPYNLNEEDQLFLKENYDLVFQIDKYDCWAKHYVLKGDKKNITSKSNDLFLKDFSSGNIDHLGNLLIFENSTITSKEIVLEKGSYEITINASSLPEKPIDGVNAHILINFNKKNIGEINLSEKADNKENKITFNIESKSTSKFQIIFDNDISKDGQDRNVIIYSIKLRKE